MQLEIENYLLKHIDSFLFHYIYRRDTKIFFQCFFNNNENNNIERIYHQWTSIKIGIK